MPEKMDRSETLSQILRQTDSLLLFQPLCLRVLEEIHHADLNTSTREVQERVELHHLPSSEQRMMNSRCSIDLHFQGTFQSSLLHKHDQRLKNHSYGEHLRPQQRVYLIR
jgi:hypothetical protein